MTIGEMPQVNNLYDLAERARRRREEAIRIAAIQERKPNIMSTVRTFLTLFFTSAGRKALAAARKAVARIAQEAIANPGWTDEERRKRAVAIVKEEMGDAFPGAAWLINIAIEFAVGELRSRLRR